MFYLTTHSTHFIYGLYMASVWSWKEVFQANDLTQHYGVGRKEMFYLTTHSTHFIYGYITHSTHYGYMASVWSWKEVFQANDLTQNTVELEGRKCFI